MPVEAGRGDRNGRATNVDGRSQRTRRYGEVLVGEPPPGDCENDCAGYRHSFMSRITGDLLTSGYRPDSGCERIARVTADLAASWQKALRARVPHARVVFDRFHVERLASDAVDEVRRAEQRRVGAKAAKALKGTRFCLLKHPARLKPGEKRRLETLRRQNRALDRAYQLKEYLAIILEQATPDEASDLLDEWLAWATRSRLGPFVRLARTGRQARRRHPGLPRHPDDERAGRGHQQQATGHHTAGLRFPLSRRPVEPARVAFLEGDLVDCLPRRRRRVRRGSVRRLGGGGCSSIGAAARGEPAPAVN